MSVSVDSFKAAGLASTYHINLIVWSLSVNSFNLEKYVFTVLASTLSSDVIFKV